VLTVVRGDGPYTAMVGVINLLSSHAPEDSDSGRAALTDVSVTISGGRPDDWPGPAEPDAAFAAFLRDLRRHAGAVRAIRYAPIDDVWLSVRVDPVSAAVTAVTTEADVIDGIDALCRLAGDLCRTVVTAERPASAMSVNLHFSCLWLGNGQRAEALRRARNWHPDTYGSRADGDDHAQG
jgi:hypothetical protein